MKPSVNMLIAGTQLWARKRQSFIAMLGVLFGIAMFIFMISFMKGVNNYIQDTMLASIPDIHIYNDIRTDYASSVTGDWLRNDPAKMIVVHHPRPEKVRLNLKNADAIISDLRQQSEVNVVSPLLSTQVFFNYGSVQLNGILDGVNIIEEARLFGLHDRMMTGRPEDLLTTDKGILLGQGLADKLNVRRGDLVTLATPEGTSMRFRVVGTFAFGLSTVDNTKAYVSLSGVQQLLAKNHDYITDIRIKLRNINNAKGLAIFFGKRYGYKAEDWESTNPSIKTGNLIRDTLTWVVSLTLLTVAGFGIYNIMNMVIASKMKDIAILKAQGFDGRDIRTIFLSQSLVIGVLGAGLGLLLGFLLSYGLSKVPFPQTEFTFMKFFPVVFESRYYFFGAGFGILTTFLAGVLPARKAARVDPVTILRG
ncbi:MAG: ABC transporter permease [Chitinophagaceae bacterium]|nr:ABC transporter permease [Chitinophagaceae bacterium]